MSRSTLKFFDSHCHFDFPAFDGDRAAVWRRASAKGVSGLFIPGVNVDQWQRAAEVACALRALNEGSIFYGVGLHPWWFDEWLGAKSTALGVRLLEFKQQLHVAAQAQACCAIGETGLDLALPHNKTVALEVQLMIVVEHITVANDLGLPIILHCRKAHNELIKLLDKYPPQAGGVLHGFTGSAQLAMEYWRRGLCIGVGGSITYPRANKTCDAIKSLPREALVLETDAPDMPLSGRQGERNSPEYLPIIALALAALRNESVDDVAAYCYTNTRRVFAL